jgi:quercetin dioxygenase-like cupin family protein
MMKPTSVLTALTFLIGTAALLAASPGSAEENAFVRFTPEQITWKAVGNGIEVATLSGDPAKPGGFYVIRVKFPPGLFSAPHFHPEDRNVTVIKGTWYTGTGDTFDLSKAVPLKTGSFMFHPARGVHWDGAKDEEVIVEISGIGPGTTIPVKPDAGTFLSTNK